MNCTKHMEMISASLDNELSPRQRAELERHLASCPECAEYLKSFHSLKSAVGRLQGRASVSPGVRARTAALGLRLLPARRQQSHRAMAVIAASVVFIGLILGYLGLRLETASPLYRELIADHLRYAPEAMPAEVTAEDRTEIHRFFTSHVPFEPVVPVLKGAQLLGGRACTIAGRKTQLLFYEHKGGKLSLYVSARPLAAASCDSVKDHYVCSARHGNLSLTLVGAAPREELLTLLESAGF